MLLNIFLSELGKKKGSWRNEKWEKDASLDRAAVDRTAAWSQSTPCLGMHI